MGLALKKEIVEKETAIPKTTIIGLGVTGISVARYLTKEGVNFKIVDTREAPPLLADFQQEFPNIEIQLGELSASIFDGVEQIIVSPGVDTSLPAIHAAVIGNQCECIGDIELFARKCKKPIVAITGSNGKSTVTTLLTEMAKHAGIQAYSGGNLSPPALDLLANDDAELIVLELSSFQLESTHSLNPVVSVVLNVSDDHLDRHGDIDNYASIKAHIYSEAKNSVINRDDAYVSKMPTSGQVLSFGLSKPKDNENEFGIIKDNGITFLMFGKQRILPAHELALQGEAGILNSLAALAIGHSLAIPMKHMLNTLRSFKGLPHRLAFVTELAGVSWFNDSKGTNIGATISSLRSLGKDIILIAGGVFKGGDLELFKQAVIEHVKQVILLGQDAKLFSEALESSVAIEHANSMQHAVEIARLNAIAGDKILLSPACASFDMYANYMQRGNDFENCVNGISS